MIDDDDLRCAHCRELASRTLSFGWLFRCDRCRLEWGHPQGLNRLAAAEMLYDAKNKEGSGT